MAKPASRFGCPTRVFLPDDPTGRLCVLDDVVLTHRTQVAVQQMTFTGTRVRTRTVFYERKHLPTPEVRKGP